jgi:hypothetical protein
LLRKCVSAPTLEKGEALLATTFAATYKKRIAEEEKIRAAVQRERDGTDPLEGDKALLETAYAAKYKENEFARGPTGQSAHRSMYQYSWDKVSSVAPNRRLL